MTTEENEEKKFVMPGDKVGSSVEYLPGFGVYAKDDDLFASNTGRLNIDTKNHSAKLEIKTSIPKMQTVGTVTYGVVASVNDNSALIDLITVKSGNYRMIPNESSSMLRVSDVKMGFVKTMKSEFKTGDIVKVKIVEVSPHTVGLTTKSSELGVVKANCSRCKTVLEKDGYKLKCPNCNTIEVRKVSSDYGNIK